MATEKILDREGKRVVLEIDRVRNQATYYVVGTQANVFESILLEGFTTFPKGFYRQGFGPPKPAGTFLVAGLRNAFGAPFALTLSKRRKTSAKKVGKRFEIVLNYDDFTRIQERLAAIRSEANAQMKAVVAYHLGQLFPKYYKDTPSTSPFDYTEDKISKILTSDHDIAEKLSKNDVTKIAEVYTQLAEDGRLGTDVKDLAIVSRSKSLAERVHLERLTKEFEQMLKKPNTTEAVWQQFLQQYILLFNTSYVTVLEKMSVRLQGKYPDFMLLNVYNYVDIFEIKKPSTNLLKKDESRGNYYWDTEVSKAISQVENYIHSLSRNAPAFREEIKELKGVDIKVVRPRGVVIAGTSTQMTNDKMRDDFRLLAGSLKNTDIILYDELLQNLENLMERLKTPKKRRKKK